jgi:arsenite methyltransferase
MSESINLMDRDDVRTLVREKYGAAALTVLNGNGAACCGGNAGGGASSDCCGAGGDTITGDLYSKVEAGEIPESALLASLGCGNPTALAELKAGETVLDLGSGGGIDVLLSARRVGPTGFAFGLDMTDEMLALAERNRAEAKAGNVTFLKGQIEAVPLPDNSVDVIISNCVINLSADKDAVLREAFRVLKPGGRFAVSDVVVNGELPAAVRRDMEAYVGCVAGALERSQYLARLSDAGFENPSIEPTRRYKFSDLESSSCCSPEVAALSVDEKDSLDGRVMGAFIRAVKPQGACCGTDCCTPSAGTVNSSVSNPMKLSQFKALLESNRDKQFRLVLPNNKSVPIQFHITEVAHVQKRFIDCGGRIHVAETCQLQAWVWKDTDHRLAAGKMADILKISEKVLPQNIDLDIEIEYEDTTISQYPVTRHLVTDDAVTLYLSNKHTDCLAKDVCLPGDAGAASCCG